MTLISDLIRGI